MTRHTLINGQTKWPIWIFWLAVFLLGVIFAWNNALTTTADLTRNQVPFENWHPYVWEFSSFLSSFILYFGIYWLAKIAPLFSSKWALTIIIHVLASVVYSLLHVLLMVGVRQIIYSIMGGQYDFGDWLNEWLYEYRKDFISYFLFLLSLMLFQYFDYPSRNKPSSVNSNYLIVKNKQGVFRVKYTDILTIESGGNYVYIHTNEQVLPMRSTMAEIEKQLGLSDFIRVHRSYIVNLNHILRLKKQSTDSNELTLNSGKSIPVSKKYRTELVAALQLKTTKQ